MQQLNKQQCACLLLQLGFTSDFQGSSSGSSMENTNLPGFLCICRGKRVIQMCGSRQPGLALGQACQKRGYQ
jgi:hypothetical protein